MTSTWRWMWKGEVLRIIDGDTIEIMADRGYNDFRKMRLRLKDIDAPELNSKDAAQRVLAQGAKAYLEQLLPPKTPITFETFKMSFDRYVADVWIEYPSYKVQDLLVLNGHASFING